MFKRGASHADWAVSMGIFIVYILSMFIIVQPGAQKVFREDNLIKIVEYGIRNASEYTLEKTPIYIKIKAGSKITADQPYDFKLNDIITPFNDSTNSDDYYMVDRNNLKIPLTISVADDKASFSFSYNFPTANADEIFRFDFYFLDEMYKADYDPEFSETSIPPNPDNFNDAVADIDYEYSFGSTEKLIGYDSKKIKNLCNELDPVSIPDYSAFKNSIGYPLTKEFRIYYAGPAAPGESVPVQYDYNSRTPVCEAVEPYQQASVFVKELVESFMDIDGAKTQARINIRVW